MLYPKCRAKERKTQSPSHMWKSNLQRQKRFQIKSPQTPTGDRREMMMQVTSQGQSATNTVSNHPGRLLSRQACFQQNPLCLCFHPITKSACLTCRLRFFFSFCISFEETLKFYLCLLLSEESNVKLRQPGHWEADVCQIVRGLKGSWGGQRINSGRMHSIDIEECKGVLLSDQSESLMSLHFQNYQNHRGQGFQETNVFLFSLTHITLGYPTGGFWRKTGIP